MNDDPEANALAGEAAAPPVEVDDAAAQVDAPDDQAEAPAPEKTPEPEPAQEGESEEAAEKRRRKNRHPAEERIKGLIEERKALERRLARYEQAASKPAPKIEEFQTIEDYEDARDEWRHARRAKAEVEADLQDRDAVAQEAQQQARAAAQQEFGLRAQDFARTHGIPDYAAKAFDPALPLPAHVAEMLTDMDEGPAVLYALAQDHSQAQRIAQLPPHRAAIELGKLAIKAAAPPRKIASKAPPPITPVTGAGGGTSFDPEKASYSDYVRHRMGQMGG